MRKTFIAIAAAVVLSVHSARASQLCDDLYLNIDAIFTAATIKCHKDFIFTPTGAHVHALAEECQGVISPLWVGATFERANQSFDANIKDHGKMAACKASQECRSYRRRAIMKLESEEAERIAKEIGADKVIIVAFIGNGYSSTCSNGEANPSGILGWLGSDIFRELVLNWKS